MTIYDVQNAQKTPIWKQRIMKAILWEEDGFLLLYKVLTGYKYQWPRNASEVRMSSSHGPYL